MSEGLVEEHNSPALYISMDVTIIRHSCDSSEDVRQGDDNAAQLLADSSSLEQAHAISDPIFAPVRKIPPEMLAKIFIECIPSLVRDGPSCYWPPSRTMNLQRVRARLGQVCRMWNTIINDELSVWATLLLGDPLPPLEIISLWIRRSRSHPLDVYIQFNSGYDRYRDKLEKEEDTLKMLHKDLWRIRSFIAYNFANYHNISPLFPPNLSTEAPMMQNLTLRCLKSFPEGHLGSIHCPQLRKLTLWNCDQAVESLISKPMQNLRVLAIVSGNNMPYMKLLQALPNLVSLTWNDSEQPLHETPRVALPSLKSLAFGLCNWKITTHFLRHLDVPSLEHLDLKYFQVDGDGIESLSMVLDIICRDGVVQLRRLTLGHCVMRWARFHDICHHLMHLESLFIDAAYGLSADELLITLSSHNPDFSSVCPQLKTLELSGMEISTDVLVGFVERRVKSDLGGPGPGLVTYLKLSDMWVDKEVSAQLAKTHSLSVHLHMLHTAETHHVPHHY